MSNFFNDFKSSTKAEWFSRLEADLKGKPKKDILIHHDEIEDIHYDAGVHFESNNWNKQTPGARPFVRSGKFTDNSWVINNTIQEDTPEKANKKALDVLMKGASGIVVYLNKFSETDCDQVVQEIGLEYIHSTFYYSTKEQYHWLVNLKNTRKLLSTSFINIGNEKFEPIKSGDNFQVRNLLIDAAQVQKCGGSSAQEIAFALNDGHQQLFNLLNDGMPVDEAVAQLKFRFGISSHYFIEIVKYRAFRRLWTEIVMAYNPSHECSAVPFIEAETISLNKSLRDPYTNLLRLTTEILSAIIGGVDELTLHSFDVHSDSPNKDKHQRLVNNIALILQEESYMNLVIDPAGGSYSLEKLTQSLTNKAWDLFQNFNEDTFKQAIKKKAEQRIHLLVEKKHKKVGINHFMNEKDYSGNWNKPTHFKLGDELILERDAKIKTA